MTDSLVRPSRRTFVRAAAWSVPVVSIAAAAPAYAQTTGAVVGGVVGSAVSYNDANSKRRVAWDLSLTNGARTIQSISITFVYAVPAGNLNFAGFEVYGYTVPATSKDMDWQVTASGQGTATVTYFNFAARATTFIHTEFRASNNSSALGTITAYVTINYETGPSSTSNFSTSFVESLTGHAHP